MVCLCMMVKNEGETIARTLRAVKPFLSCWSIVDTGSTDNTEEMVSQVLGDLPGYFHKRGWVNWSHNRNESLELARSQGADFLMILDADEELQFPEGVKLPELNTDCSYWINIKYNSIMFGRPLLVPTKFDYKYVGVVHELLTGVNQTKPCLLPGNLLNFRPGGRSTNGCIDRFKEDIQLLEEDLKRDPKEPRTVFYLAQSYRDIGEYQKAFEMYVRRTEMEGFKEEIWYSHYQLGMLRVILEHSDELVIDSYLKAFECRPWRAEALGTLARYMRYLKRYQTATFLAEQAKSLAFPIQDVLFIEHDWYTWACLDEFAISAFYVGRYSDSLDANRMLLQLAPQTELPRIIDNMKFAEAKLREIQ